MGRLIKKLISVFRAYPEIKLVYFFGSRARQQNSKLSDYDFDVYLDTKDKARMSEIKIDLIYEKEPFKVIVEPRIFNEYFDFHKMMLKHKLTKALT